MVNALRFEVKSKCLARKVTKEFDETEAKGSDLKHRFTEKKVKIVLVKYKVPSKEAVVTHNAVRNKVPLKPAMMCLV